MKAFNGIDKIQFLDENAYSIDKQTWYPSVTTVISGALPKSKGFYEWMKLHGEDSDRIGRIAMDKGSRIHKAIEQLIKGYEISWDESVYDLDDWKQINRFMDFYNRFKPEISEPEVSMVSQKLRVGGTIDMPCILKNEQWIIDTKTGKDIYDDYGLQLAAYAKMYAENYDMDTPRYGILWLNARTRTEGKGDAIQGVGWQLKELTDFFERDIKIFENIRETFDWINPNWKPKNLEYPNKLKI